MIFLAPWFLLGLLAVGIPLVLHLRRSRRRQRIVFSTTQFFDERFMRSARRARIQDLLLMLLRMALLAFFALALAQPLIRAPGLAKLLGSAAGTRRVAIIIDDSASMGALSQDGVLLERAKRGAISIINELSPSRGDKATVILAGRRESGPEVLFEQPTNDMAAVRRAIEQISLTYLATDIDWGIRVAAEAIGAADASSVSTGFK